MPRQSRESQKTLYFHIMTQGINKSYIFNNPKDIEFYINTMYEYANEYEVKIISYCIMNNHTHMLVKVANTNELSKYMHKLNGTYGKYYNTKHNRVGFVFRDRFRSEGIYTEKQFYNCMKYIYDNPVKAGICNNPQDYPCSNYKKVPEEFIDNEITFIDIEEENNREYIEEIKKFLVEKQVDIEELKKDGYRLKMLITILRNKYKLSYRQIEKELGLKRDKARRLYNK